MAGRKWSKVGTTVKTMVSANARKFQVAAAGVIAVVIAAVRDGNVSTGDKWEIAGAVVVALGVFTATNTTPPQEG